MIEFRAGCPRCDMVTNWKVQNRIAYCTCCNTQASYHPEISSFAVVIKEYRYGKNKKKSMDKKM